MSRTMRRVLLVAAGSGIVTLAVALDPDIDFAVRQPRLHVALETTAALVGLLAAFLVYGRLRRSHRLDELLLVSALAVMALTNLTLAAVPASAGIDRTTSAAWAAGLARAVGAALLVAAALAPARRITREGFFAARAAGGVVLFIGVLGGLAAVLQGWLPEGVTERQLPNVSVPELEGHPVLLGGQLVAAGLYTTAAVGFTRRADRWGDEFLGWLAIGCVLGAFSRANYFLFPSLYSDWVYVGDLFRLLFYIVLLAAALREIMRYWEEISIAAALEERRQIARDVHDGLAQELAYLTRALQLLEDSSTAGGVLERARAAVVRAQDETRRLMRVLTAPTGEPVQTLVARAAGDACDRWGIDLVLDLADGVHAEGARRETLLRVVSEAVTNVGRHSGANSARVLLEPSGARARLVVRDDGVGFDPAVPVTERGSFGLVSMRERVTRLGGTVTVSSQPEQGTTIEVIV
jgi:signal transduction histidine kinase